MDTSSFWTLADPPEQFLLYIAPDVSVKITGTPKVYHDGHTDSGKTIQRTFCGNCGSAISTVSPNMSGVQVIELGLFDDMPKPSMQLYAKSRPAWEKPVDAAKLFDKMPTK